MRKEKLAAFGLLAAVLLGTCLGSAGAATDTDTVVFTLEGVPYAGALADGKESGEKIFTAADPDAPFVSAAGTWQEDTFAGSVEVVWKDQSVTALDYKDGMADGKAVRTYEDGSWIEYKYKKDYPSGRVLSYSADGSLTGVDWFYHYRRTKEWRSLAEAVPYEELLNHPDQYYEKPVTFEGVVTDILDGAKNRYLLVENAKNQTVVCQYATAAMTPPEVLMEEVTPGDEVSVCGIFEKSEILSLKKLGNAETWASFEKGIDLSEFVQSGSVDGDLLIRQPEVGNEAVYSTLPIVKLLYLEAEGETPFDFGKLDTEQAKTYGYEELVKYSGLFYDCLLQDTAEVKQVTVDYGNKEAQLLLQKKGSSYLYYAEMSLDEKQLLPAAGETISFEAKLKGCYKLERHVADGGYDQVSYLQVPAMTIKKVE